MEDVQGFVKEPLEEDNDKEQEKALPLPSQNETEVWLFIYQSWVFSCTVTNKGKKQFVLQLILCSFIDELPDR